MGPDRAQWDQTEITVGNCSTSSIRKASYDLGGRKISGPYNFARRVIFSHGHFFVSLLRPQRSIGGSVEKNEVTIGKGSMSAFRKAPGRGRAPKTTPVGARPAGAILGQKLLHFGRLLGGRRATAGAAVVIGTCAVISCT